MRHRWFNLIAIYPRAEGGLCTALYTYSTPSALSTPCHLSHLHHHYHHFLFIMGKSQSKLSPEQLNDLQKNTYCTFQAHLRFRSSTHLRHSRQEGAPAMVRSLAPLYLRTEAELTTGTRASERIVHRAIWTSRSSAASTSNSSPSAIQANSRTMSSMSLTRTRTARSTLKSLSVLSASPVAVG